MSGSISYGKAKVEPFDIVLLPGAEAVLNDMKCRPYGAKQPIRELFHTAIKEMVDQGIGIWNPTSQYQVRFASPGFFVNQPRRNKKRLCVDYTIINRYTVTDRYPIPDMDFILSMLGGCYYFSVMDAKSGYHQCPTTLRASGLLAMIVLNGIFLYSSAFWAEERSSILLSNHRFSFK